MLELYLQPAVSAMGVATVAQALRPCDFSPKEIRLLSEPGKLHVLKDATVQRLCECLGCEPNALLRWSGLPESHLHVLNTRPEPLPTTLIYPLNQRELDALYRELAAMQRAQPVRPVLPEGRLFLHVGRLVAQRQPSSHYRFLERMGFTRNEARTLLDPDRKAVRMAQLTRLCEVFGCLPNDLYDWEGAEAHPLHALQKPPVVDLRHLQGPLTRAELEAIVRRLREGN